MSDTHFKQLYRYDFLDSNICTIRDCWSRQMLGLTEDLNVANVDNPENDAVFVILMLRDKNHTLYNHGVVFYNGGDHYFAGLPDRELTIKDKAVIDRMLKEVKFVE